MIKAIHAGIPGWADEPEEQNEILNKYKKYGDQVSHIYFRGCKIPEITFHFNQFDT